ncbi:hypothetical protein Tco_0613122 [Tanacetum coccineum]
MDAMSSLPFDGNFASTTCIICTDSYGDGDEDEFTFLTIQIQSIRTAFSYIDEYLIQSRGSTKELRRSEAKADGVRSWRQSYAQGLTLERSRTVRLELPQELSRVHHTFHVSNLKKCYADEPLVMPLEGIHVDDKLQFVEEPVEIMEREIKRLKRSRIPLVKVRWNSRRGPEFTGNVKIRFKQITHNSSQTGFVIYYKVLSFEDKALLTGGDNYRLRTAIDRFPTPAEIHRLHELSSVELSDRISVLQCQLITHGRAFHARYDHSLREVERLAKRCAQQTQIIKKQNADLKQHKESTVHASEEVSGLKAELGALKSKCEATEHKLNSWDMKHRKYSSERDTLAKEKAKIEEELKSQLKHRERQAEELQGSITSFFQSDFTPLVRRFLKSSEFNRAFAGVLNTAISVGVERGLRMGRTDEEFRGLSQRVAGFIPDAKEKFDRVIAAFPDTTFPFLDKVSQHSQSSLQDIARLEPDRVTPSSQPSSATASLRTNTHARHSTSSSETFGHTSTPEHLKKKKKPVERGGPSAA